jgi:hypothetical protein
METNNNQPRCHQCKFWTGNRKDIHSNGECFRLPPQIAGIVPQQNLAGQVIPSAMSAFPTCNGMAWCGEFTQLVVLQ